MNQFKRLIKIWTTKRSSILPIQLTMKTQQTRSGLMKNGNNWFILFFVKICKKEFLMETFIKEKAITLVSYRQKLTRRSTYQNKLYATAVDQSELYNHATQNGKFHGDLEYPLRKTVKDTFSLSLKTVFDLPIKLSSSFPHRLYFAILNQNRWSLKRAKNNLKYPLIGNRIWWTSLSRESEY